MCRLIYNVNLVGIWSRSCIAEADPAHVNVVADVCCWQLPVNVEKLQFRKLIGNRVGRFDETVAAGLELTGAEKFTEHSVIRGLFDQLCA